MDRFCRCEDSKHVEQSLTPFGKPPSRNCHNLTPLPCRSRSFQFKCPICRVDGVYDVNHIGFLLVGTIESPSSKESRLLSLTSKVVKRKASKVKPNTCVKCSSTLDHSSSSSPPSSYGLACTLGHSLCVSCSRTSLIAASKSQEPKLSRRQNVYYCCPACPTSGNREVLSDGEILQALKGNWKRWDGRRKVYIEKEVERENAGYFHRLVGGFSGL